MIRPRDAVAAIIAQVFRSTGRGERAAAKRLRREALSTVDRAAREHGDAPTALATIAALRAQEIAQTLPAGVDGAAVLCAVVRELLVDGDGMLCDLDDAIRKACFRHPLDPAAQHHVDAIVRECLAAVEPAERAAGPWVTCACGSEMLADHMAEHMAIAAGKRDANGKMLFSLHNAFMARRAPGAP